MKNRDIQAVYKKGVVAHHPFFRLHALASTEPQFTVVVSKQVHKHAVVRNRIKRQLRAIIRKLHKKPYDVVVVVKQKAVGVAAKEFSIAINQVFHKLQLL
ncbi:MAG: ribonuclease P protein component [Patescibacteria group bacterium]